MSIRQYIDMVEGQRLNELFDATGVEWVDDTTAKFTVAGEQYKARFIRDAGGSHFYHFLFFAEHPDPDSEGGIKSRIDNTGKVGAASTKVFGKALECLATFILKNRPYGVEFVGKSIGWGTLRSDLYIRMAKFLEARIADLGYKLSYKDFREFNSDRTAFVVGGKKFTLSHPDAVKEAYDEPAEHEADSLHYYSPAEAVETPSFQKWFAGSKIIEHGHPIVVYHGRRQRWLEMRVNNAEGLKQVLLASGLKLDAYQFQIDFAERLGDVVWFTDDEDIAHGYRDSDAQGDVLEAYLCLRNPLDLRVEVIGREALVKILTEIYAKDMEGAIDEQWGGLVKASAQAIVYENSIVMNWARKNGYDGMIHDDTDITGRWTHTSYVAFKPTQIKACLNDGEFNPSDPNIHH